MQIRISNAVFKKEINLEKLIDEIWYSLQEEQGKDSKPNFPKLPPTKDDCPKRNFLAFTDKNSLRSE